MPSRKAKDRRRDYFYGRRVKEDEVKVIREGKTSRIRRDLHWITMRESWGPPAARLCSLHTGTGTCKCREPGPPFPPHPPMPLGGWLVDPLVAYAPPALEIRVTDAGSVKKCAGRAWDGCNADASPLIINPDQDIPGTHLAAHRRHYESPSSVIHPID